MERNRTVLHIDDDPAILRIVSQALKAEECEVVSLSDPTLALQELRKTGARTVVLDIDMPQMDGLTLLKKIKDYDGGIQVIMLTGLVTMDSVLKSLRLGAEACLFKPLHDFQPLRNAVEASFEKIDYWWATLHELKERKSVGQPVG